MCDYQNRGHLDKVDQLDDGKITKQSRKLVVNHNYHGTKSTTWIEINQLRTTYFCDLLRWLDWIYLGRYLPSLSLNYVDMSKDIEKRLPQLYYIKMKIFYDLGFIAIRVAMAT